MSRVWGTLIDDDWPQSGPLAGTAGTPSDANPFVTTEDARLSVRRLNAFVDGGPIEGEFASGMHIETVDPPFYSAVIWWVDDTKTTKIVEKTITRDVDQKPLSIVWELYADDGLTVTLTLTETITYSGPFEIGRTREYA